ncbi:MAG: hypothetical protein KJ720_02100, partial [Proteobacteria bacterium]|nr:hypothetical protein [Pseudomonadota bacterium]MBU1452593.1 hypothetical protein [Pseudomonadota bacterium]
LKKLSLSAQRNADYQQRLEEAFQASLERLGGQMLERVGSSMAAVNDLARLDELFKAAWEQGQELPLGPDRQGSLRDLFEMNAERLRAQVLSRLTTRLERVGSFAELDELWQRAKGQLRDQSRYLGQSFQLEVSRRFDRRAQELRGRARATL